MMLSVQMNSMLQQQTTAPSQCIGCPLSEDIKLSTRDKLNKLPKTEPRKMEYFQHAAICIHGMHFSPWLRFYFLIHRSRSGNDIESGDTRRSRRIGERFNVLFIVLKRCKLP